MRNRFPGTCYRCHKRVKEGEGHFEKVAGVYPTSWRVQHADCCIAHRATADAERELLDIVMQVWSDGLPLPREIRDCCAKLDAAMVNQEGISHA